MRTFTALDGPRKRLPIIGVDLGYSARGRTSGIAASVQQVGCVRAAVSRSRIPGGARAARTHPTLAQHVQGFETILVIAAPVGASRLAGISYAPRTFRRDNHRFRSCRRGGGGGTARPHAPLPINHSTAGALCHGHAGLPVQNPRLVLIEPARDEQSTGNSRGHLLGMKTSLRTPFTAVSMTCRIRRASRQGLLGRHLNPRLDRRERPR